jgi:hypothetical protein
MEEQYDEQTLVCSLGLFDKRFKKCLSAILLKRQPFGDKTSLSTVFPVILSAAKDDKRVEQRDESLSLQMAVKRAKQFRLDLV